MKGEVDLFDFTLAIDANVELAETPIWDPRVKKLYWTDLFTGDVHRVDPMTGDDEIFSTHALIGSAIPTDDPDMVLVALDTGLHLLCLKTGALALLAEPEPGRPENRHNDTRVDARGRIFTSTVAKAYGTAAYEPSMRGGFYMVDTDGSVHTIAAGINQYNAIVWNSSNTKMFVIDTYNQALLSFDYSLESGPMSDPKEVLSLKELGMPDGMSIDREDSLYICHWTGKISIWDKALRLKEIIPFPVEYVCCGGFAGDALDTYYVASSRYCYGEDDLKKNPGAGGLFYTKSPVRGAPEHFYPLRK